MAHPENWWLNFSVNRAMGEGVAAQLMGPCVTHPSVCRVSAQLLIGDWMQPDPWGTPGKAFPTIDLEVASGLELYELLAKASVQVVSPVVAGVDGETYSLEFASGFNVVSFRWFCELPIEWQSLQAVAKRMEELGKQCLASVS
ncbi:hypothetical protein OII53_22185 [Achromobacter ruhlandii]|uniref:Uncharacterized protein n=2 Tax=Achromobacter TaxID=222 RepID=A0AAU7LDN7_9BURK|nr:hypothetical protein [Achromobacter ruhlandii]MCI1839173.1 hypothetical protein [Achromobacter ruhlandii]MCV6798525.1 hypothetical protein [Achromobacter ruhlandii]MCV6802163.1 hypothetical protein [Achromobacter ruhlandii]MCV6810859.1 hypothetical protein [Achromobacter ruhlandii]MCV6821265.1 hypothetical protein [Achromobacter ruhlandii]